MLEDIWRRYSDGVASLVDLLRDIPLELDDVTQAEGLRHLTRVLHMGVFSVHDYADTGDPRIFLAKTPAMLSGGVTSDCLYHEGFVDAHRTYRLRGVRGTAELLEIAVYAGRLGRAARSDLVDAILEDRLVCDPVTGAFEIVLGPGPRPDGYAGNWLCTDHPDRGRADWLLIRQYSPRLDAVAPARFSIEPVDGVTPRRPLTPDEIDAALTESLAFTRRLVAHFVQSATNTVQHLENRFVVVDENRDTGGALPSGHRFAAGGFRLGPDDAWLVTLRQIAAPPYDRAPYWGFQLCNFWYEPLDYGSDWAHRNNATAVADDDGSVRIVVSEERPPRGFDRNWLPLRGHRLGSAQFRLSRLDAPMPELHAEVVSVRDLA